MYEFKIFNPLSQIEDELRKVEEIMESRLKRGAGFAREIGMHLLKSRGKRIRPALILFSTEAAGGDMEEAISFSAAVELLHTATLIHDDIVDKSPLRRGLPTINRKWGNDVSVLTGDFLFGEAFLLFVQQRNLSVVGLMANVVSKMCGAEIEQMSNLYNTEEKIEDYFGRVEGKTATFFSSCCQVGPIIAGASNEVTNSLASYGLNLGMAFQILDDVFDLIGDENTLGKPVGCDLMEGILTLPVLLLLEKEEYKDELCKIFSKKSITDSELTRIKELLYRESAFDKSFQFAKGFIEKAKSDLHILPDTRGKSALMKLADYMLERNF